MGSNSTAAPMANHTLLAKLDLEYCVRDPESYAERVDLLSRRAYLVILITSRFYYSPRFGILYK
jgi:hypothetical protein